MRIDTSQVPPQDIDAEASVLGAVILDNDVVGEVSELLAFEDFYKQSHGKIFRAMMELSDRGEPLDLLTLSNRLKNANELEQIGGTAYLAALADSTPTAVNVMSYARIVCEKSQMRKALALIRSAEEEIRISQGGDLGAVKDDLIARLSRMDSRPLGDFLVDGIGLAKALQKPTARKGIYAPIPGIDGDPGFVPGELIILAGRPGFGKSSMMCNVVESDCLRRKIPTIVFSLEMPKEQVGRWIIAKHNGIAERDLPDSLSEEMTAVLDSSPLHVLDKSIMTIEQIEATVKRIKEKRIVIIDHIQRIATRGRETRNQEVGENIRRLKSIAKDYKCTVLALSQLNRKGDELERPNLSWLRDSGEIEQEADIVVFNWTLDEDRTGRTMKLACYMAKNRGGQTKERWLEWDKMLKTFRDANGGFTY